MDERWQEIERIYHAALELEPSARAEYLAQACAGDPALREEVESLLAHVDQAGSFLENPPVEMVAKAFGNDERFPGALNADLELGTMIAHYRLAGKIGEGGMGEVYRAVDTKLQRDVALKILPQAMAQDAERMARFEREAHVLASLNHPNIAAIHGLEESNGIHALVMELVEGETLGERISVAAVSPPPGGFPKTKAAGEDTGATTGDRRSTMNPDDVLPIARQIAEALEYAHERGVIHRDLKPANVKITPEGTVKVLDFGLAKVLNPQDSTGALDRGNSPTLTSLATQPGMLLGTAAYMSPEQAKGLRVDRRGDIWAFGCVLYEMLSGRKVFDGETISDVLAAVLTKQPDWTALPETTPPDVQKLIRRCLMKDTRQRLRDIGDARIAIEETLSGVGEGSALPAESTVRQEPKGLPYRAMPWALALVFAVAALVGWWRVVRNKAPTTTWSGEILPVPITAFWPRVSRDGHLIAFLAMVDNLTQVAVMDPGSGNWTVLTHDRIHGSVGSLCWSHDGSRIYFDRYISVPRGVYSVPSLGGEARLLLANAASPEALPDGSLLITRVDQNRRVQIYHFWPETGRLQALGVWKGENPLFPTIRVFPGGKEAAFFGAVKGEEEKVAHLYLLDITTGRARQLAPELKISPSSSTFPLAVTPDGRSVLIDLPSDNLHRIVAIPRSGAGPVRTLKTLTSAPWSLDETSEGDLYIDQVDSPLEMLRLPQSGGTPEVLASLERYPLPPYVNSEVELSGGRFLLPAVISSRSRVLLGKSGGSFVSLLETNEETAPPMVQLGGDQVALMVGSPPARALAVASIRNGRIIRRFKATEGKPVTEVAASPDGKTLYYVSSNSVWSIPSKGGNPRKVCAGDGLAVDPNGRDLIVNLTEQERVRLERVPLSGSPAQPIVVRSDLPLGAVSLGPRSINNDGRLLVTVIPTDSWFLGLAILDLATGRLTQVPLNYTGDVVMPGWADDGRILTTAVPMRAHIWRFRPTH